MKNAKYFTAQWLFLLLSSSLNATAIKPPDRTPPYRLLQSCDEDYPDLNEAMNDLFRRKSNLKLALAPESEIATLQEKFLHCCTEMLQQGKDVNNPDFVGATPAMLAVSFGEEALLELFIKKGADMNKKDHYGTSANDIRIAYRKQNLPEKRDRAAQKPLQGELISVLFPIISLSFGAIIYYCFCTHRWYIKSKPNEVLSALNQKRRIPRSP